MKKSLAYGVIVVILAIIVFALLYFYGPSLNSKSNVEQQVVNFYELANPGVTAQVIADNTESGMLHMVVKLSNGVNTTFSEVWTTTDGKFMTVNPILLQQSVASLNNLANFVSCLNSKNLRIYGTSNSTGTQLQLNLLGTFSPELFNSCDSNITACVNAGVRWDPTIAYGNNSYPGPQAIGFFENITSCKLT